jgi:hypothetical protein
MKYRCALVLTMATRADSVFDVTKSECTTLSSNIKTGIGIRDFVSVFEMSTSDYKIYDVFNSESSENRYYPV